MDKTMFFWTLLFPIILGTFFWMAFSDITKKNESIERIDVAVVDEGKYENAQAFNEFIENVSGKDGTLNAEKLSKDDAQKALDEEKVEGIIYVSDKISVEFKENGMNQTILKSMVDSYIHNENVILDIMRKSPDKVQQAMDSLYSDNEYTVKTDSNAERNMDVYVQYYFALFAMTCLFGAQYGHKNTREIQQGQSDVAVRRCVSPTKKLFIVFTDFMAALTIQMFIFTVVFLYLNLFLGINFGSNYGYIFLAGFLSSFVGISYGYMVGVALNIKESTKESIITGTSMAMCFLSGLMVANIKNLIENTAPIINRINPASVISDSFYAVSVFDDMGMYLRCTFTLAAMGTLFAAVSVFALRNRRIG